MTELIPWLALAVPTLPLVAAGFAARGSGPAAGRWTTFAALGALSGAVVLGVLLLAHGPMGLPLLTFGGERWDLRLDSLSVAMSVLVAFLGFTVMRFSRQYLAGDPGQSRFLAWLSATVSAVLTLVLAGHLLLLLAAWVATSLSLHRLLLFYPERARARFAARKKFVVSRLGDACLLAAAVLIWRHYGTLNLEALFARVGAGDTGPMAGVGFCLVGCAAFKSAQFPFHSWLPDTMETPTPVSALMHAGIINAGGFLILRLSPLLVHAPVALGVLAILGAVTAAFGSVIMLAQPSVKRALAFSTIAQMGFMLLECGLGAFSLALLHLLAHSLYKAHAFLHAGSTIGTVPRSAVPLRTPALLGGVAVATLFVAGAALLWRPVLPESGGVSVVLAFILMLAVAYGLARVWSSGGGRRTQLVGTGLAGGIAVMSLGLHAAAGAVFSRFPPHSPPAYLPWLVGALFSALFVFQVQLWRTHQYAWGRALYIHVLNGGYVGIWANRILHRLWPRETTRWVPLPAALSPDSELQVH